GQDGLAPEHVSPLAGRRGRVVNRQRAKRGDGRILALAQVRLTADEGRLLDPRPLHVRLDEVELELELVAVGAVALLEPACRAVDADPERDDAVRSARLPERVPQALALFHRYVQLPAELADVRDARSQDGDATELDRPARAEREAGVRDVVGGRGRHHVTRPRTPDPGRAPGRGRVVELRRAVGRQVVPEPLPVAHTMGAT